MFGQGISDFRLRQNRRLSVDALESRVALSTTAVAPNGILGVVGDNGNQTITITKTGAASFSVAGLTAGTQTFSNVKSISVNTKGGDDRVTFVGNGSGANLSNVSVTGDGKLIVDNQQFHMSYTGAGYAGFGVRGTGSGTVIVALQSGTQLVNAGFSVQSGAGNDSVFVAPGVFIQGRTLITLSDGANYTGIDGANLDVALTVAGGVGADTVTINNTRVGLDYGAGFELSLGDGSPNKPMGADSASLTNVLVKGNGTITSTQGSLTLNVTGTTFRAILNTTTRGYLDVGGKALDARVSNSIFDSRLSFTSKQSESLVDGVSVWNSTIGGEFKALTAGGADVVGVHASTIIGNAWVAAKGMLGLVIDSNTVFENSVDINTSTAPSGNDSLIRIENSTVKKALKVQTGAGYDVIQLWNSDLGRATGASTPSLINSYGGNDVLDLSGSVFFDFFQADGGIGFNELKNGATFLKGSKFLNFQLMS